MVSFRPTGNRFCIVNIVTDCFRSFSSLLSVTEIFGKPLRTSIALIGHTGGLNFAMASTSISELKGSYPDMT
jgi:hypothetical protein